MKKIFVPYTFRCCRLTSSHCVYDTCDFNHLGRVLVVTILPSASGIAYESSPHSVTIALDLILSTNMRLFPIMSTGTGFCYSNLGSGVSSTLYPQEGVLWYLQLYQARLGKYSRQFTI
ncbi:hypothetical protein AG1IA_02906 [Rhizoctonia solani AG-1 IA]|uniref:Uncharacterized protein n=1 Tax=Thanatephorus cucumeris (strain AG1-IA) TaxID=983506 RepID=L8X1S6_THACA|nr:hypothetical protein AG1IA_02906 [Rhizoctonia solani AG-1 IA]